MAVDHNNPQSRNEEILIATIDGTEYNKLPQSRMEELLLELKEAIEAGGGGGTSDYENLTNQPQVNGETLIGNKTGAELGLVDAEEGKGLSTNDYDNTEKAAVAAATSAISAIKDGTDLDSFGDVEVALLDKADISDLGTAAVKDSTNAVTSGSTDLVESGAVKDAIDAAVSSAYHHAGTKTVAQLTHDLLVAANEGNVYNITDSGTTTSDFIEGIGKTIDEGSNVGICKVGDVYMFDLLSGFVDTTNFIQKSQTSGLLRNDGTVNDDIEGDVDTLKEDVDAIDSKIDDTTTYPYASSITIPDAIPANLAECKVKIEPVQDLHGYDHPWVGGAGKNKLNTNYHSGASVSQSNVTVTKNDDGSLDVTITGSCSATVNYYFKNTDAASGLKAGNYKATVRAKGTYTGNIYMVIGSGNSGISYTSITMNNDASFTVSADGATLGYCLLQIPTGATVTGTLKLYPMIADASADMTTWESYSNICPISGHTEASVQRDGKNLFDKNNSGEIFTGYMSPSNNNLRSDANSRCCFIPCEPNTTYTLSKTAGARFSAGYTKETPGDLVSVYGIVSDNTASSITITTGDDAKYLVGYVFNSQYDSGNADAMIASVQIEIGSTATTYEPYQGKTYTITLGDTIYGGTVDFNSGVMTVDRASEVFDGSSDEYWFDNDGCVYIDNNNILFSDGKKTVVANMYRAVNDSTSWAISVGQIKASKSGANTIILLKDAIAQDAATFKAFIANNPLQVCYELATPFTVQLTPQQIQLLKGTNTLTASTGDISVTVNGVSGAIGQVQEQVNATDEALAGLAAGLTVQTESYTTPISNTYARKYGKIVTISIEYGSPSENLSAGTGVTLCKLPSEYRPTGSDDRYLAVCITGNIGSQLCAARLTVKRDGDVVLMPGSAISSGTHMFLTASYII